MAIAEGIWFSTAGFSLVTLIIFVITRYIYKILKNRKIPIKALIISYFSAAFSVGITDYIYKINHGYGMIDSPSHLANPADGVVLLLKAPFVFSFIYIAISEWKYGYNYVNDKDSTNNDGANK